MPKFKRLETILLVALIACAIFFRFWQIRDYMVFLGDEGRDAIIIRNIFVKKALPFLGPTASVGGFYLGPIYYWMAAPFLWLWRYDPVGPSYMVAIFGVATVLLLYKLLKEAVGFWPAILVSSLYATAPLIVRYSRSSWNPNPVPFFSLLLIYSLYRGILKKRIIYFALAGACFGIAIQLHYLTLILIPIVGLTIILNENYRKWPKVILLFILGFLVTFSPFLAFEIRHHFPNFHTIWEFATRGTTTGYDTVNLLLLFSSQGSRLLGLLASFEGTKVAMLAFWALVLLGFWGLLRFKKYPEKKLIFLISLIWFLGGLAGLSFYKGAVFDYYYGFMFPAPFLLLGLVFYTLQDKSILRLFPFITTAILISFFIANGFYRTLPNRLIDQTEKVADLVIEKAANKPYNFALISDHNSDHAYRYFLEIKNDPPKTLEEIVTSQLLIVCESKKCAPLGNPGWEIAGFGRAEIKGEWNLSKINIRVFRLTHWPGVPNPAGKPAHKEG